MESEKTFRVAVLGMGRWGRAWAHVINRADEASLAVTAGGRPCESENVRPPRHFSDYRDAIEAADADAVVITLPVQLHLDAVRRAAARGLHVLCEKPAVPNRTELRELEDLAESTPTLIAIDQNYRQRPWVDAVRRSLPWIGRLAHVSIEFAQPEFLDGGRGNLAHPLIADMAIHHVDLLRHLTGQDARVVAALSGRPRGTQYRGEPDLSAVLALEDKASVTYSGTWSARGRATPWDGDWLFRGENGSIAVTGLEVTLDLGTRPQLVAPAQAVEDDSDLARVLQQFRRSAAGDPAENVPVSDNARSLSLVFDLADAVGLEDAWRLVGASA
jgi:predicted dehydrogenase